MRLGVYGTLLDPEVRALVLGEEWRSGGRPGLLRGWRRVYVAGEAYPGICRRPGAATYVLILEGITSSVLMQADRFEGGYYRRQLLPVVLTGWRGGPEKVAFYVPSPSTRLSGQTWRYDQRWRRRYRSAFMAEARKAFSPWRAAHD